MTNYEEIIAIIIIVSLFVGIIIFRVWYIRKYYKQYLQNGKPKEENN